jgi:hypothetical protein
MTPRSRPPFAPVTLGQMRAFGCRDILIYCDSIQCNHGTRLNADWLPDETVVRSLRPRMVCTRCGLIGAEVRPDWSPHTNPPPPS